MRIFFAPIRATGNFIAPDSPQCERFCEKTMRTLIDVELEPAALLEFPDK